MKIQEKISRRLESNKEILKAISELVEKYPDQRFGQILANYVFPDYRTRDIFFEESIDTLQKVSRKYPESNFKIRLT